MTAQAQNQEQIRAAWDAIAARFDEFLTPQSMDAAEDLITRAGVRPRDRVLDVGCGSGSLSIVAARRHADVTAVDIAPAMIELLGERARREGLSSVNGLVMDGQSLALPDDAFDVAVSLNGVSLIPDLAAGLAEMVRVTRPGGRVAVGAFGPLPEAEFIAFVMAAMQATVPDFTPLPADSPPPPFRLADPAAFRKRLVAAGLNDVSVETITWHLRVESASHLWDVFTSSNPIGAQLVAGLDSHQRADVLGVLDRILRERSGGGPGAKLSVSLNVGVGTP